MPKKKFSFGKYLTQDFKPKTMTKIKYEISVGFEGPTDDCLCINDKEYMIDSEAWNIIALLREVYGDEIFYERVQKMLEIIYKSYDQDLTSRCII